MSKRGSHNANKTGNRLFAANHTSIQFGSGYAKKTKTKKNKNRSGVLIRVEKPKKEIVTKDKNRYKEKNIKKIDNEKNNSKTKRPTSDVFNQFTLKKIDKIAVKGDKNSNRIKGNSQINNDKKLALSQKKDLNNTKRENIESSKKVKKLKMPRTNVLKEGVRFLAAAKILNLSKKAIFDVLISYGFPKENITPTSKMNQEMAEILNAKFKV